MRYLKLASAQNPDNDFIELNDFNGFLCTRFETLGIKRRHEFLAINNRQFSVDNKTDFKEYRLTIEILTKYAEYEREYRKLINFLDRNKKGGFRLYYRPYEGEDLRYCLCDIESSVKTVKLQPVVLTLSQNSLWLGEIQSRQTSAVEQSGNLFAFAEETIQGQKYYSASFYADNEISNYYCIRFYNGALTTAEITNNSYNEIPLIIRIRGACVNPTVSLFRKGENTPMKTLQILANIAQGYYVEINANILENGVKYKPIGTGVEQDYDNLVNNALGSPYFYIDNGEYYVTVRDANDNVCDADISWQEEYSE